MRRAAASLTAGSSSPGPGRQRVGLGSDGRVALSVGVVGPVGAGLECGRPWFPLVQAPAAAASASIKADRRGRLGDPRTLRAYDPVPSFDQARRHRSAVTVAGARMHEGPHFAQTEHRAT